MAHLNHCDGFNDGSEGDEFVSPFHDRFPMRRHRNMEHHVREDNDWDPNIKKRFPIIMEQ